MMTSGAAARSTLSASAVTSGPMPSPPMTASLIVREPMPEPYWRVGPAGGVPAAPTVSVASPPLSPVQRDLHRLDGALGGLGGALLRASTVPGIHVVHEKNS